MALWATAPEMIQLLVLRAQEGHEDPGLEEAEVRASLWVLLVAVYLLGCRRRLRL